MVACSCTGLVCAKSSGQALSGRSLCLSMTVLIAGDHSIVCLRVRVCQSYAPYAGYIRFGNTLHLVLERLFYRGEGGLLSGDPQSKLWCSRRPTERTLAECVLLLLTDKSD